MNDPTRPYGDAADPVHGSHIASDNHLHNSHLDNDKYDEKGVDGHVGVYAVHDPIVDDLRTTHIGDHGTKRDLVSEATGAEAYGRAPAC